MPDLTAIFLRAAGDAAALADGHYIGVDQGGDLKKATLLTARTYFQTGLGSVYQPLDATLTALAGLNATAGIVEQTGADAFTKRLIGVTNATDIPTRADADARYAAIGHNHAGIYQPVNADLSAIAALTPANDDILQRKAGVWTNRTIAQVKTDFGLAAIATSGSASDLNAGTVPDARFPSTLPAVSGVNLTALNASNIASGSLNDARLSANVVLIDGSRSFTAVVAGVSPVGASDLATKGYVDGLLLGLLDDRGNYDASVNTFPASGGSGTAGAILKGDLWTISVAGTLGGHPVTAGDVVRALVDTPGQTDGNWAISENNLGYTPLNAALNDGQIYIGNGSNIGTARTLSGDVTVSNTGVMAIGATKVVSAMLNSDVYSTAHSWGGQQTFTAPVLGTPASGTLTNCTGLPVASGISGLGTGIATALAVNVGSAGAPVLFNGALGTPTSGVVSTGVTLGGVTMTLGSDADGDIYYRASNVLTRLPKGTAGQVLTMNAGATAPEWAAAGGGGSLTVGTTVIASGTATRLLYETSGNVLGEISGATSDGTNVTFGSGNLIATSAALTTPAITTSAIVTRNSLGVTNATGVELINNTAAAAGAQQVSPDLVWTGQGWKTTATAASQTVNFRAYLLPVQGTTAPTANWVLQSQINGGGYTDRFGVKSDGTFGSLDASAFRSVSIGGQNAMGWYRTTEANPRTGLGTNGFFAGADQGYFFSNTNANASATSDTAIFRQAAAVIRISNSTAGAGSLVLGTSTIGSIGTSGVGVFAQANGTAPGSSPADEYQLYSADWNGAGTAAAHFRNEEGHIVKICSQAVAALTNNVTSGGTNDQITDWTDLTVYATDAAAIRNAIYQLSRKLAEAVTAQRANGLFR